MTRRKQIPTVIALSVSAGIVLLAAGPVTAISHRAIDGVSVIETKPQAEDDWPVAASTAAGRATYR